jgi:hypothetical protein
MPMGLVALADLVWDVLRDAAPLMLTVDEVIDDLQLRGHGVYSRGAVRVHLTAMVNDGFAHREVRDAPRSPFEYGWGTKGLATGHQPSGGGPSVGCADTSPAGAGKERKRGESA